MQGQQQLCNIASLFEEIEFEMIPSLIGHTKRKYWADLTPEALTELKRAVGLDERKGLREASERALIPHDQLIVRFCHSAKQTTYTDTDLMCRKRSVLLQSDI
jgi:hypothetical protein